MSPAFYILDSTVYFASIIFLFFSINHLRYSPQSILLAFFIRLPFAIFIATLNSTLVTSLFYFLFEPLFGILLAYFILEQRSKTLLLFYGLFPFVLWNLFYRSVSYFIFPILGLADSDIDNDFIYILSLLGALILTLLFLKLLRYDFEKLRTEVLDREEKRILKICNWLMILYFVILEFLTYFDYEQYFTTVQYRKFILVFYLVLFMGMIKRLDDRLRIKLQEKIVFQQNLQLRNMRNYSEHIESLYREVRGFRHDYVNLLTTLRLAIEDNDMSQINTIYRSVLKDSSKRLRNHKYDIARLINIDNVALKSLLAAKFIQANENEILVNLEVPEAITPLGMELVDFITIVSILSDNALEATLDAITPKISIAFLKIEGKQLFIIENSIKEEEIDISKIYSFGYSSKGDGRGIGLYNVMKIIEQYPNVSLSTMSSSQMFTQTLEVMVEEPRIKV